LRKILILNLGPKPAVLTKYSSENPGNGSELSERLNKKIAEISMQKGMFPSSLQLTVDTSSKSI